MLHDTIKPAETKVTVKSMKIELVLTKETPGKWPILRKQNAELFDNLALGTTPAFNQFHTLITGHGYKEPQDVIPSFGSAPVDEWAQNLADKLKETIAGPAGASSTSGSTISASATTAQAAPVAKPTETAASTTKGPAYPTSSKRGPTNWDSIGDDEKEEKEGDVNAFFKEIYKDADEDTRRAMMKSYVESNGTALSTSWTEVKDKKYETMPPEGAEAKKWS